MALLVNQLTGFGAGAGGPVTATYIGNATNENDLTTYTFSGQSIGTAAADRIVVVGVHHNSGGDIDISSVTIGGNAATAIVTAKDLATNTTTAALYALLVPTGTTADIVVTLSAAGAVRAGIGVWNINGKFDSIAAFHTASATSGDPTSVSLNIPDQGCVIAVATQANAGTVTVTWSGTTERYDQVMGTADNTMTGASTAGPATASSGTTISADWASAPTRPALAAASWGPT